MFWQELVMDHIVSSLHNTKGNRVPLLLLRQDQFIMHKKKKLCGAATVECDITTLSRKMLVNSY